MNFNYRLPKVQELDSISVLNTPAATTDVVLASGVLTILDESGAEAIELKACDLLGFRYNAYTAGTANVVDVDLTAAVLVANNIYSLTISAPYVQNFFGGGQETKAVYIPRTYTVSVDATPTVAELQAAFVARIAADPSAYFSAASVAGDIVRITADSALAGQLFVETNVPGITAAMITSSTAWVAPVGTTTEILSYVPNSTIVSGTYNRYIIQHRRVIRHNAVSGLGVIRNATSLVYLNTAGADIVNTLTKLTSILNGSYTPVAGYLGCPAV
jgi:DNA-directed RNA polymerase subunit H (RpoH/RPB5)